MSRGHQSSVGLHDRVTTTAPSRLINHANRRPFPATAVATASGVTDVSVEAEVIAAREALARARDYLYLISDDAVVSQQRRTATHRRAGNRVLRAQQRLRNAEEAMRGTRT